MDDAGEGPRLSFRLKDSIREETVGDLVITRFNSIQVELDRNGNLLRESMLDLRPALSARQLVTEMGSGKMTLLNFRNAPLEHLLQFYGDFKGQKSVLNPDHVSARITCTSEGRLTEPQTLKFMDIVLADLNLSVVSNMDGLLSLVAGDAR